MYFRPSNWKEIFVRLPAFKEYGLKKRLCLVSFWYPGSNLGSVLVSIKNCRLLPSLSSFWNMSLVFVGTESEFTFQQETMTSWSGEVCVREVYCMQYTIWGNEGGLGCNTILILVHHKY